MNKIRQIFLWMFLLNKRMLKEPLFLLLIAMVPCLVFGVGRLSQESSSLVTAAVAPQTQDDEASAMLIRFLVDESTSAVRYIAFRDKEEREAAFEPPDISRKGKRPVGYGGDGLGKGRTGPEKA